MALSDFLEESDIHLALHGRTKDEILAELVGYLGLGADRENAIRKMLEHREESGSTGVGRGLAVPHCRTTLVPRLRVVFGRHVEGVDYRALDEQPTHYFFLLVAPPVEVSNDYLPVLGQIAGLTRRPAILDRLGSVETPAELRSLLAPVRM